jgi:MFS transporter, YNFM family, putative membrane transport protein
MHTSPADFTHSGTPAFRRTNLAMFASGVATFGFLYCVQPIMPEFSRQFQVSAATSALSLSLPSAVVAFAILFAGPVSNAYGRKAVMSVSLLTSAVLVLLTAVAPTWHSFLALRALLGLTLGGLPSVAMTYLNEEMHPESIGLGMGLYIGGNAAGGLGGRLITGVLTDYFGWRIGLAAMGMIGSIAAFLFIRSLPPSRHFNRQTLRLRSELAMFADLFRDRGLPWLFAEGFVLLGSLVTVYNYIGYRLMAPPYAMSQARVGMIFSVYLVGVVSSSWIGHLAGRLGRRKVLWSMFLLMLAGLGLTIFSSLWLIIGGISVITFGFFGGHSIASSWVGRRAGRAKAHAASIYLFVSYMGSSVAGAAGGVFYAGAGWRGVAAFVAGIASFGLMVAWRLYYLPPLPLAQKIPLESPLP